MRPAPGTPIIVARHGKILGTFEYNEVMQSLWGNRGVFERTDYYWFDIMPGWLPLSYMFEPPKMRFGAPPPPYIGSPPPFIP